MGSKDRACSRRQQQEETKRQAHIAAFRSDAQVVMQGTDVTSCDCNPQAQIRFSHPVQYINSAQIRLYTNALTSVLQSIAPQLADIAAPTCTGGYVQPPPPFSPESDATITAVYEVHSSFDDMLFGRSNACPRSVSWLI